MKKTLFALALGLFSLSLNAQKMDKCATMPSLEERLKNNPELQKFIEEQRAKKMSLRIGATYDTTGYLVIPVVFHVVYNPANPEQNIADSNIISQINVLNADFSFTSFSSPTTLSVFDSIAADCGVRFCLASVDPDGNPTTGITRTSSTTSHLLCPITNSVKADATGGKDPWPSDKYFNVWVCSMFPAVLGYATFPWDDPALDGVVLNYEYVGEHPGGSTAPNNMGRTCTHESGHWLGMRHVWGDGGCDVEDGINDTPDSDAASSGDCALTRNDCDDAGNLFWQGYDPVDMVQNFMDYSGDACMTMYTRGQMHRMWHYLLTYRDSLFHSNGCGTPALNGYAIAKNITCSNSCDGEATVYPVVGTAPFSYLWNTPNADTSAHVDSLCHGSYVVRVIDADNDTIFIPVHIITHNNLAATLDITHASCSTCTDGAITVNALGGNPAYTYTLNSGTPQTSPTFTGLGMGTYTVTVQDSCGTLVTLTGAIGDITGTKELTNNENLLIYPNPANEILTIRLNGINSLQAVDIIDITGRSVSNHTVSFKNELVLTVSTFENGTYLIRCKDSAGKIHMRSFIKN